MTSPAALSRRSQTFNTAALAESNYERIIRSRKRNICSQLAYKSCPSNSFSKQCPVIHGRRSKGLQTPRASTCIEELTTVRSTEPLTKKDLINYFASGCKPKHMWRIGTEHEKFGYELERLRPIGYEIVASLLEGIARRYNWNKIIEDGFLVGLSKDGKSITLEGGGQVELSGSPLVNLHQTAVELDSHFSEIKDVAQEMGIGFLGCGTHPNCPLHAIPTMPKEKLSIQLDYYSKTGTTVRDLALNTCSIQVNLDFSSEEDMVKKLRVGLALQPIVTALFANSPFTNGKPNGFLSYRSETYKDLDTRRTGMLPFVFDDNFGFERYVEYALNVPMVYAYRKNRFVNCNGMSFNDFVGGKLPNLPGDKATMGDWQNHLVQIFTEVRLKTYLEIRDADVGSPEHLCALPAFWVGLLYDESSLRSAMRIIEDWTTQECQNLRDKVTTLGLKTPFRGSMLKDVAQVFVKLAKEGLQRRGWEEAKYLDFISEVAKTGTTPAERLLKLYNGEWKGNVNNIFQELLY